MNSTPDQTKIFVGRLSTSTTREELTCLFSAYGTVIECVVIGTYAFVHMATAAQARHAIDSLNGVQLHGSTICVEISINKGRRHQRHGTEQHSGSRYDPYARDTGLHLPYDPSIRAQFGGSYAPQAYPMSLTRPICLSDLPPLNHTHPSLIGGQPYPMQPPVNPLTLYPGSIGGAVQTGRYGDNQQHQQQRFNNNNRRRRFHRELTTVQRV